MNALELILISFHKQWYEIKAKIENAATKLKNEI